MTGQSHQPPRVLERPASSGFNFAPRVLRASQHMSWKPSCFTPLVLRDAHHTLCKPILLHTACPASLHASHHSSCDLHTTRPGSRFGFTPHVLQATLLHITCPACFTPLRIQGCVTDRGIQKSLPFFVFATQFPKLSASFIPLSSNHRVTNDGVHEARAGAPLPCTDAPSKSNALGDRLGSLLGTEDTGLLPS